jgi:hypothetical protein
MPVANLPIPTSPHAATFAEIVRTLKADARLRNTVKRWIVPEGNANELAEPTASQCPAIRIMPALGPDAWYGPQGFIGPLYAEITLYVAGTNATNLLNLRYVVAKALYPDDADARLTIQVRLVAAGVQGHFLADFGNVAFGIVGADEGVMLSANMQIQCPVTQDLNP